MRKVLGHEAFHWGVMVIPENHEGRDCWAFEATDATEIDPITFRMKNPTMSWWLRSQNQVNPDLSSKLIGLIMIGSIPDALTYDEMELLMTRLPMPVPNQHPQQSCVTWAGLAISTLQAQGWVKFFDVEQFKDWALGYGDDRVRPDVVQPKIVSYP
jgi:uncharacterized protein DUF6914